jgi:phage terminase small subunit
MTVRLTSYPGRRMAGWKEPEDRTAVLAEEARQYDTLLKKRRAFVDAYCGSANGNGVLAAHQVGYKCPTRAAIRLLAAPEVQAAIKERQNSAATDSDEGQTNLAALARSILAELLDETNPSDIERASEIRPGYRIKKITCEDGVRKSVNVDDRNTALDLVACALGLSCCEGSILDMVIKIV